jgi:hypothetical protein
MTQVSSSTYSSQRAPTRTFGTIVIKTVDDFYTYRDAAYALTVNSIQQWGQTPAAYDVRPISPVDDFGLFTPLSTLSYSGDWSIASGALPNTGGALNATGNLILNGTMPQQRWMVLYGTELLTNTPAPEVMWKFSSGSNVKSIWFVQDLFGWASIERPKLASNQIPVWGPANPCTHTLYVTGQRAVYDVHLTQWAEPTGYTITASNVTA